MKNTFYRKMYLCLLSIGMTSILFTLMCSWFVEEGINESLKSINYEITKKYCSYVEESFYSIGARIATSETKYIQNMLQTKLEQLQHTVVMLSSYIPEIVSRSEIYSAKTLENTLSNSVKKNEQYPIYNSNLLSNATSESQLESEFTANIVDILNEVIINNNQVGSSFFICTEKGWLLDYQSHVNADNQNQFNFSYKQFSEIDPSKYTWYTKAKKANSVVVNILPSDENAQDDNKLITISAPFYDVSGNFLGVVAIEYPTKLLKEDLKELNFSDKIQPIIIDTNTNALANMDEFHTNENNNEYVLKFIKKKLSNLIKESNINNNVTLIEKIKGEKFLFDFVFVKNTGCIICTYLKQKKFIEELYRDLDECYEKIYTLQKKLVHNHNITDYILSICILIMNIWGIYMLSNKFAKMLVQPIKNLTDIIHKNVLNGNFKKIINFKSGDEIEKIAISFNIMIKKIDNYMKKVIEATKEKERIVLELKLAKDIQNGMLPKNLPSNTKYDLLATMETAREIGGDFYDFFLINDKYLAFLIADVSGKGISAATFMSISKVVLNNIMENSYNGNNLSLLITKANEQLFEENDEMMFVTAFVGILDLQTGELKYVNAGHNPPVYYNSEKDQCEFLDVKKNFVLGPMPNLKFVEQKMTLNKGDLLFLYTDGVTEALNPANEEYLPDRLINFMNKTDCTVDLQILLQKVRKDITAFVNGAEQSDDLTMLAVRFKGDRSNG